MSEDWAKRAFKKIRREQEEARKREEADRQRESVIAGHARHLWGELAGEIERRVRALNTHFRQNVPQYRDNSQQFLDYSIQSDIQVTVAKDSPPVTSLKLEFEGGLPMVVYTITKYATPNASPEVSTGEFLFNLFNGQVFFHEKNALTPTTTDVLAERLLNELVGI